MLVRSDRSRRAYDVLSTALGAALVAAVPPAQWLWIAVSDTVGLDVVLPAVVFFTALPAATVGLLYVPWGLLGHGPRRAVAHAGLVATTAAAVSLLTRGWFVLG